MSDSSEQSSDYDEYGNEEGLLLKSGTTTWRPKDATGTYSFHSKLQAPFIAVAVQCVTVRVTFVKDKRNNNSKKRSRKRGGILEKQGKVVGMLVGFLVGRPGPSFQRDAKRTSEDFYMIAREAFTSDGSRCMVRDDLPFNTEGSILHLENIEVNHWGCDLGLRLVHETLQFVRDRWAIVTLFPAVRDADSCHFIENKERELEKHHETDQDQCDDTMKLMKHFARLGFLQLAKNRLHFQVFILPHELYFPKNSSKRSTHVPWRTTGDVALLDIYFPPPIDDDGLLEQLESVFQCGVLTVEDTEAISRLATAQRIDDARLFHYLASEWKNRHLFDLFAELGGNVNLQSQECGRYPLHHAALAGNRIGFQALMDHGANHDVRDLAGLTPLDYFLEYIRDVNDDTDSNESLNLNDSDTDDSDAVIIL
jgi:hypothetical protein